MLTTTGHEVVYDPLDVATHVDPYPVYKALRAQPGLYYNSARDFWALSTYEQVRAASQDWETFSSADGVEVDDSDQLFGIGGGDFLACDPPKHDLLRDVVRRGFTPRAIEALEDEISAIADQLIVALLEQDVADLSRDLAQELPVLVMCSLLDLPPTDAPLIRRWFEEMFTRTPGDIHVPQGARQAASALREYLAEGDTDRVGSVTREVPLALIEAERAGRITKTESLDIRVLLLAAGIETTSGLISHLLLRLAQDPQQWTHVVENALAIPDAVEEALRYDTPAQWLARHTTCEVTTDAGAIPSGARVLILYASANRDERRFAHPDEYDVMRPAQRHLGFGNGIHFCVGAPLARLEARVVLRLMTARVREMHIVEAPVWRYTPGIRDLSSLGVRLVR